VLLIVVAVIRIRQIVRNDLVDVFTDEVDFWEAQNPLLFVFVQKRSVVMQRLLGDIGWFGTTKSMFLARTRWKGTEAGIRLVELVVLFDRRGLDATSGSWSTYVLEPPASVRLLWGRSNGDRRAWGRQLELARPNRRQLSFQASNGRTLSKIDRMFRISRAGSSHGHCGRFRLDRARTIGCFPIGTS
jgi:hypothetical protein